jgi:hypothetical protein
VLPEPTLVSVRRGECRGHEDGGTAIAAKSLLMAISFCKRVVSICTLQMRALSRVAAEMLVNDGEIMNRSPGTLA